MHYDIRSKSSDQTTKQGTGHALNKNGSVSILKSLLPGLFIRLGLVSLMASLALFILAPKSSVPVPQISEVKKNHYTGDYLLFLNTTHRLNSYFQTTAIKVRSTAGFQALTPPQPAKKWLLWGLLIFSISLLYMMLLLLLDTSFFDGPLGDRKKRRFPTAYQLLLGLKAKVPVKYITQKSRQNILSVFERFR